MNLLHQLAKAHSKENAQIIAKYIGNDVDRFADLMKLFFHNEYRVSQRAAHTVSHCVDVYPHLIRPFISQMIHHLQDNPEVAIRRNTVRLLQNQEIPEEDQGLLVEKCFEFLLSAKETTAVKVFSMTILYNMAKIYPELKKEVILVIEEVILNGSSGLINRGQKILNKLNK